MEVRALDTSPNNVIVHIEGRSFPGLVVQGDTFHSWVSDLKQSISMARAAGNEELAEELEFITQNLEGRLAHYESVLSRLCIEKPY